VSEPKFIPPEPKRDPRVIETRSIVSHRTGRGVVIVEWNNEAGEFDPEDARAFAHCILREADIAETDAFLYSHFKEFGAFNNQQLAFLITGFRKHRARLEQLAGLRPTGQEIPEEDRR
jgi:hypothetical protein